MSWPSVLSLHLTGSQVELHQSQQGLGPGRSPLDAELRANVRVSGAEYTSYSVPEEESVRHGTGAQKGPEDCEVGTHGSSWSWERGVSQLFVEGWNKMV